MLLMLGRDCHQSVQWLTTPCTLHYLLFPIIKILIVRDWERLTMALIRDCWQFSDAILNLCMYYEGGPWHFLLFFSRIGRTEVWDWDNELKGRRDACHRLPTSVTHNLFKGFWSSRSRSRCESGSYLVVAIRRMVLDCQLMGALTSLIRGPGQKFRFWESWAFLTTSWKTNKSSWMDPFEGFPFDKMAPKFTIWWWERTVGRPRQDNGTRPVWGQDWDT